MSAEDRPHAEEVVPILRVRDAGAAVRWYARLGFVQQWEHRFEPGFQFGVHPEQAPWGPEPALRDPDGNRLRVGPVGA
ncbi:hypothetical protein ACIQHU_17355 [Streptomyces tendae]|uniref:hypothetical protein n=1 Tax=Streptomyces tendae TaxID=1932 RepID=UPI0034471184